jgi:hypothetical protein
MSEHLIQGKSLKNVTFLIIWNDQTEKNFPFGLWSLGHYSDW